MRSSLTLFLFALCGSATIAAPLPIDIRNSSFEEQKATLNGDGDAIPIGSDPGDFTAGVVPQWTAASAGLFNPDAPLNFAPDSTLVVFLDNNGNITQPLVFPGGAAVTASPGAVLNVTMQARPRFAGTSNMTFDARVGGVSIAAAPATLALPANAAGYSPVNVNFTLKNAAGLGAANGQQVTLFIGSSGTQANIDAVGATITYPPAINTLSAAPQPATAGQPVTISWTVAGADTLNFNGSDVTGQTNAVITAPAVPQSYTLSATNADGTSTASVLVDVLPGSLPSPAVRINEVVTENTAGLQDEDATFQDWIELYNTTGAPVSLAGWHLTDDRMLPAKWTFPAASIPAGGYLTVFASAKNRATSGQPLHTNFKLDNDGEYIALTNAASVVVSVVNLPSLAPNTSWGYGTGNTRNTVTVSPDNAALKWTVPAAAVSDDWRGGAPFDDTAWASGQWALGYSNQTTNPYAIAAGIIGGQNYAGALGHDFDVVRSIQVTELACFDSGSNGMSRTITTVLWSRNQNGTPSSTSDDTGLAVLASEVFSTASPGTLVGGQRFKPLAVPVTLAPGSYTILAYNYGSGEPDGNHATTFLAGLNDGGGAVRFVGSSRFGVTAPPASPAASFPGSPDGGPAARYGAGSFKFREPGAFATGTEAAMFNVNASILTRTAFTVPGAAPQCASLNVTYDDGFVAWLNGVEVARRNAPAVPDFNSTATATALATANIPLAAGALEASNVLAIQGLNLTANDGDFQLRASISGEAGGTVGGFIAAPTPGALNGGATLASQVVINEIHSDPPDSKLKFVEFVELYNPLNTPVNVGGWSLTGGVTYSIPGGTIIPACGHLVIAESPAQLQTYLAYSGALGPWSGSLRNEGDEIVLRDPSLAVVDRVTYELSFPWPTVGDDPGDSMQRINEGLDSNLGASWRSALPTPGARNSVTAGIAPPAIRQVAHTPVAPVSGQAVTISAKITDPDGVAAAWLDYQIVEPGSFIRLTDPAWNTNWITVPMTDDGSDNFTAIIPATVQTHRRLIRYRIRSWDGALAHIRVRGTAMAAARAGLCTGRVGGASKTVPKAQLTFPNHS